MWLFSAAASLFVAAPVALTAMWQVPRGTKISRNISLKSIFRLFREIYFSERKIVTLPVSNILLYPTNYQLPARNLQAQAVSGTYTSHIKAPVAPETKF